MEVDEAGRGAGMSPPGAGPALARGEHPRVVPVAAVTAGLGAGLLLGGILAALVR